MRRFCEKLSSGKRFWLGFWFCPVVTWLSFAAIALVTFHRYEIGEWLPYKLSPSSNILHLLSGAVFSCAIPIFCGFCTAFFWHTLAPSEEREVLAGFWSIVLGWLPLLIWVATRVRYDLRIHALFLLFVFLAFYYVSASWSSKFWLSSRSRHWFGDFYDMS